jgi:hypothetical protein
MQKYSTKPSPRRTNCLEINLFAGRRSFPRSVLAKKVIATGGSRGLVGGTRKNSSLPEELQSAIEQIVEEQTFPTCEGAALTNSQFDGTPSRSVGR